MSDISVNRSGTASNAGNSPAPASQPNPQTADADKGGRRRGLTASIKGLTLRKKDKTEGGQPSALQTSLRANEAHRETEPTSSHPLSARSVSSPDNASNNPNPGPDSTQTSLSARRVSTANNEASSPSPITMASANDSSALKALANDYIEKGHPIAGLTLYLQAIDKSPVTDKPTCFEEALKVFEEVIGSYGSNHQRFVDGRNAKLNTKNRQDLELPKISDKAVMQALQKTIY